MVCFSSWLTTFNSQRPSNVAKNLGPCFRFPSLFTELLMLVRRPFGPAERMNGHFGPLADIVPAGARPNFPHGCRDSSARYHQGKCSACQSASRSGLIL